MIKLYLLFPFKMRIPCVHDNSRTFCMFELYFHTVIKVMDVEYGAMYCYVKCNSSFCLVLFCNQKLRAHQYFIFIYNMKSKISRPKQVNTNQMKQKIGLMEYRLFWTRITKRLGIIRVSFWYRILSYYWKFLFHVLIKIFVLG